MPKKKTHYAVRKGRQPGIYVKWFGADGAAAQVESFPNAQYKGFYSEGEAEAWLNMNGAVLRHYNKLVDRLVAGDDSVTQEAVELGKQLISPVEKAPWED